MPLLERRRGIRTTASRRLAVAAAQAEDAQEERGEEHLDPDDRQRRRERGEVLLGEGAEAALDPDGDDDRAEYEPDERHRGAQDEPVLQPEARAHAVEP